MTLMAYLITGLVVWAISGVEIFIREGKEYFKTHYNPRWIFFTDLIMSTLLWPMMIFCYALGAFFKLLTLLRTEL